MLFHIREYHTSSVGSRTVSVKCVQCGCDYFYTLVRVGYGTAGVYFGLRKAAATRTAEARARIDQERRLGDEAEVVPCPRCGWINEELVARFLRGRCRGLGGMAFRAAVLGIVFTLPGWLYVFLGPAADREAILYASIGILSFWLGAAGVILAVRAWRRRSVRPGRSDLLTTALPRGRPPALVVNPATGRLETVGPERPYGNVCNDGCLELQIGRQTFPPVCCQCLRPTPPWVPYQLTVALRLVLAVPFCPDCARHRGRRRRAIGLVTIGAVLAAGAGLLFALGLEPYKFLAVCLVAPLAALFVANRATAPMLVKAVDLPRGVLRLRFRNGDYLTAVARPGGATV